MPLSLATMHPIRHSHKGIFYMLLAALGFSIMAGFAKTLRGSFNAPQLVFYRNVIGFIPLVISLWRKPAIHRGGLTGLLVFRGIMGTLALYTLLFSIIHMPLGTAMTYNTINTFFIALLSAWLLNELLNGKIWSCILLGFTGVVLICQPSGGVPWNYHMIGLLHGLLSALAYMSIRKLHEHYDTRTIVLSFLSSGLILPACLMLVRVLLHLPADDFLFPEWTWPAGVEWIRVLGMGLAALAGQYFVTKAYASDKAGIVAAMGYSNILFSVLIGLLLGDSLPDGLSIAGMTLIIVSGIGISFFKQ